VTFPPGGVRAGWAPLQVRTVEGAVFAGWWQRFGSFVLTVAAVSAFDPPRPLVDPPGLASAVPAESWRQQR
jgi:4'-phosphopantetheinyl transferase